MSARAEGQRQRTIALRPLLYAAAALSLLAGLIHSWVTPEHFAEWWGYGAFFLAVAVVQAAYAVAILRWPSRRLYALGIVGNLAVVGLWVITRTVGIPFFGPDAGEVEAVGPIDALSTPLEALLVIVLGLLLWRASGARAGPATRDSA